jgi:hypothetical protein
MMDDLEIQLQRARREGYLKRLREEGCGQHGPMDPETYRAKMAREAFPIRRNKPRIEQCPFGPWVRSDGEGGVDFYHFREDAEKGDDSVGMFSGVMASWLPVINDVAANPTEVVEVEE